MKKIVFIVVLVLLIGVAVSNAQTAVKFKNKAAVADALITHLGEALSRLEANLTQVELDKVENIILNRSNAEKKQALERAKTLLESVKADAAVVVVDAELDKLPKVDELGEVEPK